MPDAMSTGAPVHNRDMSDDPVDPPNGDRETQQASNEATERMVRLHVWLNCLWWN